MIRILKSDGSEANSAAPELTDTERQQQAAAVRAQQREEAAAKLQRYVIQRAKRPNVVRMPEMIDVQILLDERKALYEHLGNMEQQATLNVVLIMRQLGVDRVEITGTTLEEIAGWNIRQTPGENETMILELVRPDPAPEDDEREDGHDEANAQGA